MKRNQTKKFARAKTISLMLATFFLPFGYDALFALIMKWTGSYWTTDIIFYFISAFFFGLYLLLSQNSPKNKNSVDEVNK